jgi:glycogen phosphorylase
MARADDPAPGSPSPTSPTPSCGRPAARPAGQAAGRDVTGAGHQRPAAARRGHRLREAASGGFDPDRLTIGFARRLATYKRLLPAGAAARAALALLGGEHPVQFVFAGKAHPLDDNAKRIVARPVPLKSARRGGAWPSSRTTTCPRRRSWWPAATCGSTCPARRGGQRHQRHEGRCSTASLNLSVLDGWWAEAYDGSNGWAIDGASTPTRRAGPAPRRRPLRPARARGVPLFHD